MRKLAEAAGGTGSDVKASQGSDPRGAKAGAPDCGIMGPIAARILMKVMYAARLARPDLQRAICHFSLLCHKVGFYM